jgi:hypothetical protein
LHSQDVIKDIKRVFPKCEFEESPFAQVHPFLEELTGLQIPRRQPRHGGFLWIVVFWCVLVCVVLVDCCMCVFGTTWQKVKTKSP